MRNKIIIIGILVAGFLLISGCIEQTEEKPPLVSSFKQINLYGNGKIKSLNEIEGSADVLLSILQKLNLQARCVFFEDRINQLKQNGKIVELVFKKPVNITISQWIEPEERSHIPNANGCRILTSVKSIVFVLEGDMKGNILIGREWKEGISYGCWAIKKPLSNEIDKTWIDKINQAIGMTP